MARVTPFTRLGEPPRVGGSRARISALSFPFLISEQPDLFATHATYWVRWHSMRSGPRGGFQSTDSIEESIEDGHDSRRVRITLWRSPRTRFHVGEPARGRRMGRTLGRNVTMAILRLVVDCNDRMSRAVFMNILSSGQLPGHSLRRPKVGRRRDL